MAFPLTYSIYNTLKTKTCLTHLEVHHAWPRGVAVAHAGLLEQGVDLEELVVAQRLVDLVAHQVLGSLEILVKTHIC